MELEQRVIERTAQLETANKELESLPIRCPMTCARPLRRLTASAALLEDYQGKLDANGKDYPATGCAAPARHGNAD